MFTICPVCNGCYTYPSYDQEFFADDPTILLYDCEECNTQFNSYAKANDLDYDNLLYIHTQMPQLR